ncbi:MAG TPA: triose-phosphate isomerase [Thermoanaerobaculia bacterium]|nr:triose-phosphate isomerase [Thermoanaerobaculia bacterium]
MSWGEPRLPLVAGNWKMNLLRREARSYCTELLAGHDPRRAQVVLFPSFPLIPDVAATLEDSAVGVGGQDLHPAAKGAHTGDVSAPQLIDAGCTWVLVGHSERRRDHGETDEVVAAKLEAAMEHGLTPVLCVGETREERLAGRTFEVLDRQLNSALGGDMGELALAYEPVWAIGTGETASPEQAQEAHLFLRGLLADLLGEEAAREVRILYGGSVTPDNAAELIRQPDVDGFLVGGASLDPKKFLTIIHQSGTGG